MNAKTNGIARDANAKTSVTANEGTRNGPRRLPPEILSDAEVCALMRACGRHAPTGLRNRALIAFPYRTGLCINGALSLHPKDFELSDGSVRVLIGKGAPVTTPEQWAQSMLKNRGIQGIRVLVGLLSLSRRHSCGNVEQACEIAQTHGAHRLRAVPANSSTGRPPSRNSSSSLKSTHHPAVE